MGPPLENSSGSWDQELPDTGERCGESPRWWATKGQFSRQIVEFVRGMGLRLFRMMGPPLENSSGAWDHELPNAGEPGDESPRWCATIGQFSRQVVEFVRGMGPPLENSSGAWDHELPNAGEPGDESPRWCTTIGQFLRQIVEFVRGMGPRLFRMMGPGSGIRQGDGTTARILLRASGRLLRWFGG